MNALTLVFLIAVVLAATTQLWLARRQNRAVASHRSHVPPFFAGEISEEDHKAAADYTLAKTRFEMAAIVYHTLLLLLWTIGGGLNLMDTAWRGIGWHPIATGFGVIASVTLVNSALSLPLAWYRTFVIEQRFGFNHTGPWLFVTDRIKAAAVAAVLGGPLIVLILWVMSPGPQAPPDAQTRSAWWLYVWLAWSGFSVAMLWVYPAFVAPLFNRFSRLNDETLRSRINALLSRTGFTSDGIYVMDGSRRSAHGNAYFTGLGSHKRIVFFDTLLGILTPQEIEAVLAHELGHYRHHHVHKRLAVSLLTGLLALWALSWVMNQLWFYVGLGLEHQSNYGAVLLFAFILPIAGFFSGPLFMHASRAHEYQADDFAARHTGANSLASALIKLYRENAVTVTPDPLYSAFHYSHPPAADRLAHLSLPSARTTR